MARHLCLRGRRRKDRKYKSDVGDVDEVKQNERGWELKLGWKKEKSGGRKCEVERESLLKRERMVVLNESRHSQYLSSRILPLSAGSRYAVLKGVGA